MSTDTTTGAASRLPLLGPGTVIVLHLVALVVFPPEPSLLLLGGLEGVSLLVCTLSLLGGGSTLRTTVALWAVAIGLYGVVALARSGTDSLALVALALGTVGTLVGYGLHRVERVRLGLVSDTSPETD